MNPFRGYFSLCAAALAAALIATPAAFADAPGPVARDAQAGQQLVSDITVLTGLNRMRLTQGQMRDIVQRLSLLSHAEETYAEHETNTSETALAAMRQVEKALQDGQEVDPAAQAKVDAVLNPLKAEGARVDQLRDETIQAIERELRPEQLAALMQTLGIQGEQAMASPDTWGYRIDPNNALALPLAVTDGRVEMLNPPKPVGAPEAETPRLLDLGLPGVGLPRAGQPDAVGPKDGARIEDEGQLNGKPHSPTPIPQGAATPPPAAQTAPPAAAGSAAPILYGTRIQQGNLFTALPPTAHVEFYTLTATAPPTVTNVQLQETAGAPAGPEVGTGAAPVNPNPETDRLRLEELRTNLDAAQAEQQARIADLEQRLQKLNAQTMQALKMIQQTMAQLHFAPGQVDLPPVGMVETPDGQMMPPVGILPGQDNLPPVGMVATPDVIGPATVNPAPPMRYNRVRGEGGYAFGGGFAVQRSNGDEAVRRFFLQPNVLRFLKARLANQQ